MATWILLALAVVGCMDLSMVVHPPCEDSLDCEPGWKCNQEYGYCEPIPILDSIVDFELTPERGSGSAATQVADLDLDDPDWSSDDIELELNKAVTFSGHVTSPLGVPGSILAKRDPEFGTRSLSWNFQVGADGYYEALVAYSDTENNDNPRLNTYDAMFWPSNREDFPQLLYTGLVMTENGLAKELSFPEYKPPEELDDQEDTLLIKVRVLEREDYPHPRTDIQIEGTTEAGLRTNLVTPDIQGYAHLRLPVVRLADQDGEMVLPQWLNLTMRPKDSSGLLPTVKVTDIAIDDPDLGTFYLGDLPEKQEVTGMVVTVTDQPVANCQLRFKADGIGNGTYEKSLETDNTGNFSPNLLVGRYQVIAVPDLYSTSALSSTTIDVEPDMGQVTITLNERLKISGRMRDSDGNTIGDVIMLAERTAAWLGIDDGVSRTFETISDPEGNFELKVDPGLYDLTFIPPPASGLPRLLHEDIIITDQDEEMTRASTTLPRPKVIQGNVFNHGGNPMCGVTVDVYRSDETEATLIGQAMSYIDDEGKCDGAFSMVVPSNP